MDGYRLLESSEIVESGDQIYLIDEYPRLYLNETTGEVIDGGEWKDVPSHYIGMNFGFAIHYLPFTMRRRTN